MPDQTTLAEFKLSLAGELIQPGEKVYDEARQVYNGMIDRGHVSSCGVPTLRTSSRRSILAVSIECSLRFGAAGTARAARGFVMMAS
jgi:hypothetical protein